MELFKSLTVLSRSLFSQKASSQMFFQAVNTPLIVNFMDLENRRYLMRIFVTPLFNFYPLVSMFYNRKLNNRVDKILQRMLSLVQYHKFLVSEPFRLNKSIKIHQRNTQVFATWFPKVKKKIQHLNQHLNQNVGTLRKKYENH